MIGLQNGLRKIAYLRNCDCEKIAISQLTQFIFLSEGRYRNTTKFNFLEDCNCEIAKSVKKLFSYLEFSQFWKFSN